MPLATNQRYVPVWLSGKDLTYVRVDVANRDFTGAWTTAAQTLMLTNTLEGIRLEEYLETQDIRPVNRRVINHVITGDAMGATLTEIMKTDVNFWNILPHVATLGDYFYLLFARGLEWWELYGLRGAYREGITDYGKNTIELPMLPIDVGYAHNVNFGQLSAPVFPDPGQALG